MRSPQFYHFLYKTIAVVATLFVVSCPQEEFANVLLFEPSHQQALYELASVSYLAGDVRTAQVCVDAILKKDPMKPEYVRAGALIYAVQGVYKEKAHRLLASYKTVENDRKKQGHVEKRVNDWLHLHDSGNVVLVTTDTASPTAVQTDSAVSAASIQITLEKEKKSVEMGSVSPAGDLPPPAKKQTVLSDSPKSLHSYGEKLSSAQTENMIVVDALNARTFSVRPERRA